MPRPPSPADLTHAEKMQRFTAEMESLPDSYIERLEGERDCAMDFARQFPARTDAHLRRVYETIGFAEALEAAAQAYPPGSRARAFAGRIAAAVARWGITWDEVVAAAQEGA